MQIVREMKNNAGRYVARITGIDGEAELTFTQEGSSLVMAEHTFAPETMRGTGVAKALVERLVADARTGGFKIVALCPYVKAQFVRHPDWDDVIEKHIHE